MSLVTRFVDSLVEENNGITARLYSTMAAVTRTHMWHRGTTDADILAYLGKGRIDLAIQCKLLCTGALLYCYRRSRDKSKMLDALMELERVEVLMVIMIGSATRPRPSKTLMAKVAKSKSGPATAPAA